MRLLPCWAGVVVAIAFSAACSTEGNAVPLPPVTPHVFVGHVAGSSALIALVESDDVVIAYTCGIGDKLRTHTGWYYGVKQGVIGENIQVVNGPSGLRLRGSLDAFGGAGVLTLADASEVAFTVEPARGEAGLFDYEDAGDFVGFIRANDGSTAGSSTSRITTVGVATTTVTPVVSSVTAAPTSPPPTTPTGTVTLPPTLPVTVDNGLRLVITTPILKPENRIIRRSGPVVVFLMHGMADNLGMAPAGAQDDFINCAGVKDTPFYGRCEWGQDFLPGLFGTANVRGQLTALDGSDATGDQFIRAMQNVRDLPDENLGHAVGAGDCVTDPQNAERVDPRFAKQFITPGPLPAASQFATAASLGLPPVPPQIAAMVTWRDSTRGLVFSGRRVTRQIYAALRWYENTYKITPGVILLAQSFGGLATRFMLSKPDPAMLTAETNREGTALCTEDLAKMDYVRDRTLFLVTIATPHEGSYLAEWGPPVKDALRSLLAELAQSVANSPLAKTLRLMATLSTLINVNLTPTLTESVASSINGFVPQLDSAPALLDMRLKLMERQNLTTLSPERARRTAASPILGAQKALIPVYATLSRSPGSDAFDGPDVIKGFKKLSTKRKKAQGWVWQTMLVSDVLTRQLVPHGFGDATVAPYAQHRNILDRRARLFDASPSADQLQQKFATDIRTMLSTVSPWFLGKFGNTGDAVLTGLQSAANVPLPRVMVPIHTDQKWKIGFDGTTIDVPMPALQCGTKQILIDLDSLARLLVKTYANTPDVLAAIGNQDLKTLLVTLGVLVQDTDAFAKGVAEWFVGKLKELGTLPQECDAVPDNVFDVFATAELLNWKVVASTGKIPVPVFIGTGEPVSDGEMDTDGAVHSASALGFTLGREPFYFEHDRTDDGGKISSWYRLYDNPVTERRNHGSQYENDVGLWVRSAFLASGAGPIPARDTFSVWP
jgi:hypothetical protein